LKKGGVLGLDLRAKYGINALGIAVRDGSSFSITWSPAPEFIVHPGDFCIVMPINGNIPEGVGAIFKGFCHFIVETGGIKALHPFMVNGKGADGKGADDNCRLKFSNSASLNLCTLSKAIAIHVRTSRHLVTHSLFLNEAR